MPFFLFIVYILIEIALFAWLGDLIGVFGVLAEVVISFFIGVYLIQVMADRSRTIMNDLQMGIQTRQANPKFYLLLSGVLLIVPGFLSDGFGLLLLIPPVRHALWARIGFTTVDGQYSERGYYREVRKSDDVIEGEIIDKDE